MEDFFQLLLKCPEDEIEELVISRARELEESLSTDRKIIIPNESLFDHQSYYHGFIKSDVKVYSSLGNSDEEYYTLGNYDYLISFFKFIRKNNITNKNEAIKYLTIFIDQYFGEYCGVDQRAEYIRSKGGEATIDIFKSKGLAACTERSAAASNIMAMMGLDPFFLTGTINGEQHSFNILINKKNQVILVDTTSCCGLYDSETHEVGSATYIYNLGELNESLEAFLLNGKSFKFYDTIARITPEGTIKYETNGKHKVYQVEPIILDEEKTKSL